MEQQNREFTVGQIVGEMLDSVLLMPEEVKEAALNMSVREFLDHCRMVAERLNNPQVEEQPNPTALSEAPKMDTYKGTIYKRDIMEGRQKCPLCSKGTLQLVDGDICCPVCKHSYGDVDLIDVSLQIFESKEEVL